MNCSDVLLFQDTEPATEDQPLQSIPTQTQTTAEISVVSTTAAVATTGTTAVSAVDALHLLRGFSMTQVSYDYLRIILCNVLCSLI